MLRSYKSVVSPPASGAPPTLCPPAPTSVPASFTHFPFCFSISPAPHSPDGVRGRCQGRRAPSGTMPLVAATLIYAASHRSLCPSRWCLGLTAPSRRIESDIIWKESKEKVFNKAIGQTAVSRRRARYLHTTSPFYPPAISPTFAFPLSIPS